MIMHPKAFLSIQKYQGAAWSQYKELNLYSKDQQKNEIEVVKEYEGIKLRFESINPNDRMYIEKYDTEELVEIEPGDSLQIIKTGETESMLVPGDYLVLVRSSSGVFEALYRIEPKNMSWGELSNLKIYLEKKLLGLSFDLLKNRTGVFEDDQNQVPNALKIYQHFQKNFGKLRFNLEKIIDNPIVDVVQIYEETKISRKPDNKSQRWLSKKGASKNVSYHTPMYFKEKHTTLTKDNLENRWVKHIVRTTRVNLKQLQTMFRNSYSEQQSKIEKKQNEQLEYEYRISRIINKMGFETKKRELNKLIQSGLKSIDQLIEGRRRIERNIFEINKYIAYLSRVEQGESLALVKKITEKKPTLRLLQDSRYSGLYQFYRNIESLQKRESAKQVTFPYKKTSLLFEYYVLCLVIDILRENNYKWTNGWLADETDHTLLIGNLSSETSLIFEDESGEYYIELAYDTIIVDRDESISHFKANIKKAPDIRVSIYKNNNEFLNTLILDAKYRSHRYLWDDKEENDVMKQLSDYLRIWHWDINKPDRFRLNRSAVSKVIAVYPKQMGAESFFEKNDRTLAFVQIEPSDPESNIKPFGYNVLKQLIDEFLDNTIEVNHIGMEAYS